MFEIDNTSQTKSNRVKLRGKHVQLDCTIFFFFANGLVKEWNKLPPSEVQCDTISLLTYLRTNLTTISSIKIFDKEQIS